MDGATVERLSSALLGGDGDEIGKKEALKDYAKFLRRRRSRRLTESQKKSPHASKLAATPKSEQESRVVMTVGARSKVASSSFIASKLKKSVEEEKMKSRRGSKPAGAESI